MAPHEPRQSQRARRRAGAWPGRRRGRRCLAPGAAAGASPGRAPRVRGPQLTRCHTRATRCVGQPGMRRVQGSRVPRGPLAACGRVTSRHRSRRPRWPERCPRGGTRRRARGERIGAMSRLWALSLARGRTLALRRQRPPLRGIVASGAGRGTMHAGRYKGPRRRKRRVVAMGGGSAGVGSRRRVVAMEGGNGVPGRELTL